MSPSLWKSSFLSLPDQVRSILLLLKKILVDLFSRKLTGKLLPRSEYPVIFEDCFQRFRIDEAKMLRYARRRNIENDIREFITKETTVHLHV